MSELINADASINFRLQLFGTASALAFLVAVSASASAEETDRPTVWIELGGELMRFDGGQQQFAPASVSGTPRPPAETVSPLSVGHAPRYSFGGDGKVTLQPNGSDWVLSAAIRFGRSNGHKHLHQQSYPTQPLVPPFTPYAGINFQYALPFSDVNRNESESHAILDFQVGKDIGVGLFGRDATSVFSLGVRFAQFAARSNVAFKSQPDFDLTFKYIYGFKVPSKMHYHENLATANAGRSFHGIGPSLAWNASAPVLGSHDDGELALNWGINGALLFGRQKAAVHHQSTHWYHSAKYHSYARTNVVHSPPFGATRSHAVAVPNIGGFASLSMRYPNARVSFGYRADFFFGAMDAGIDARKSFNRGFYGPYATLSVGIGG